MVTSQMSAKNLAMYVKYKGYNTDYRELSLNNLKELLEEFDRIENENKARRERRKSRRLLNEPTSAEQVKKESDRENCMSVDNTNTVMDRDSH